MSTYKKYEFDIVTYIKLFLSYKFLIISGCVVAALSALYMHDTLKDKYSVKTTIYGTSITVQDRHNTNEILQLFSLHLLNYSNFKEVVKKNYKDDSKIYSNQYKIYNEMDIKIIQNLSKVQITLTSESRNIENFLQELINSANDQIKNTLLIQNRKDLEISNKLDSELEKIITNFELYRNKISEGVSYSDYIDKSEGDFLNPIYFLTRMEAERIEVKRKSVVYQHMINYLTDKSLSGDCCIILKSASTIMENKKISETTAIILSILSILLLSGFAIGIRLMFLSYKNQEA
ncbi:hypothetical protein N8Y98_03040 [Pelagibacterales bacterium]|nr:hypothetical protein [Pelagibacterales bacterium]